MQLALALHPDKNGAPGADEAFKCGYTAFQPKLNFLTERENSSGLKSVSSTIRLVLCVLLR
jgi:hypothetical protein